MPRQPSAGYYLLILSSFLVAVMVAIYPLSGVSLSLRPELVCLLVIYWVILTPQYFGVFYAWLAGAAQDLLEGVAWGAHALALSIVAYMCLVAHQRIKNYSIWHQSLWIFVLVGFHQVIVNWVQSLSGYRSTPLDILTSTAISALFWPIVLIALRRLRLRFRHR